MTESDIEIREQIQNELRRRPDLSLGILFQFAVHIEPALANLDLREFNVAYVVPAKRHLSAEAMAEWRKNRGRRPRRTKRVRRNTSRANGTATPVARAEPRPSADTFPSAVMQVAAPAEPSPGDRFPADAPRSSSAPVNGAPTRRPRGTTSAAVPTSSTPSPGHRTGSAPVAAKPARGAYSEHPARVEPTPMEPAPPMDRATVRSALFDFAHHLAAAERRADWVRTLTDVDRFVDRLLGSRA